jgi:hypothetical protein
MSNFIRSSTTIVKPLSRYAASDSKCRDHALAWIGLNCIWRRAEPMNVGRVVKMLVCLRCLKHSSSRMSAVDLGGVGMNFHCMDISKSQPSPTRR